MRQIRVAVIDDEPVACRRIVRMIKEDPEIKIVSVCTGGAPALESINTEKPDLLLLDIQMPDLDGFEILRKIPEADLPLVIFVTAFNEYAVKAFEIHAIDYLLKPIELPRVRKALAHAKEQLSSIEERENNKKVLNALLGLHSNRYVDRIAVKHESRVLLVRVENIESIKMSRKHLTLNCGKESFVIRHTLAEMEEKLDPAKFVRIHKSAIVNVDFIQELRTWFHGDCKVILKNGHQLMLSRRFRSNLKGRLNRA